MVLVIDKVGEMMQLLNEYELGRKYGKTMTVDGVKHDLEEFKDMVRNDQKFYNELRMKIITAIKGEEMPEEEEESPIVETTDSITKIEVVTPNPVPATQPTTFGHDRWKTIPKSDEL